MAPTRIVDACSEPIIPGLYWFIYFRFCFRVLLRNYCNFNFCSCDIRRPASNAFTKLFPKQKFQKNQYHLVLEFIFCCRPLYFYGRV